MLVVFVLTIAMVTTGGFEPKVRCPSCGKSSLQNTGERLDI